MNAPRPLLVFLHIPKTAGSTLMQIIERQYAPEAILLRHQPTIHQGLGELPPAAIDQLEMVMGHLWFGVHHLLPRPVAYLTVLRDPVERVISHYYYVQRHPQHHLHQIARELSLEEYVTSGCSMELQNDQVRLVAGGEAESSAKMLANAQQNLDQHFAVVGLTEQFDRSLMLMQRRFGWHNLYYLKRNVVRHPSRAQLPAHTLRVIEQHNQLDLELYRLAQQRFHEQLQRECQACDQSVRRFQLLNASYGKLQALTAIAAQRLRARRGAGT